MLPESGPQQIPENNVAPDSQLELLDTTLMPNGSNLTVDPYFDSRDLIQTLNELAPEKRREVFESSLVGWSERQINAARINELLVHLLADSVMSSEDMLQTIRGRAYELGLSPQDVAELSESLTAFSRREQLIQDMLGQSATPGELIEQLFGVPVGGRVEVARIRGSIVITCFDLQDFVNLERANQTEISSEDIFESSMVLGMCRGSIQYTPLNNAVILMNATNSMFEQLGPETVRHEWRHMIYRLMEPQFPDSRSLWESKVDQQSFSLDQTPEQVRQTAEQYWHHTLAMIETSSKEEILAQLESEANLSAIFRDMQRGYDFLPMYRLQLEQEVRDIITQVKPDYARIIQQAYEETITSQRIVTDIHHGLLSIYALHQQGFSTNTTIALLSPLPLEKWPSFVNRIIAGQKVLFS